MKVYLISYAQNATPEHPGLFSTMKQYCKLTGAELCIIAGRYKNPTSRWSKQAADDDWWAEALTPYVLHKRKSVCPNLRIYGDISIQPTASNPCNGFEVFMGRNSGVFGHPKRAMKVVPTGTRSPRVIWTTSACTVPNYTDSKAGKIARAHHVLGALVVEVDDDGVFFARHVSASADGSFTDLGWTYTPTGRVAAAAPVSITLGDYHAGREDQAVLGATKALVQQLKPKNVVGHDWLDFNARNHHAKGLRSLYTKRAASVQAELTMAAESLKTVQGWGDFELWLIRSNHDEAFERWLDGFKPEEDPTNAPYYFAVRHREFSHHERTGKWPDVFHMECVRLGVRGARFLRRNESLRWLGVEHGFHGDKGNGGSRGTPTGYAKLGVKVTTGHTHTPSIQDGSYVVGVTAGLDHGYNLLPSTWMNAHVVLHADGKRQLIVITKGRHRGGHKCQTKNQPASTRNTTAATSVRKKPRASSATSLRRAA